ncbi:MAG: conjugal transfer protein, partial [Lachnospiraceae bacterium]|nr:conjugal transfer protein [Lachnospiraceae bacterium]
KLFGTTEFLGLNMGFWVSMIVVAMIVILMNVVFWGMKPKNK